MKQALQSLYSVALAEGDRWWHCRDKQMGASDDGGRCCSSSTTHSSQSCKLLISNFLPVSTSAWWWLLELTLFPSSLKFINTHASPGSFAFSKLERTRSDRDDDQPVQLKRRRRLRPWATTPLAAARVLSRGSCSSSAGSTNRSSWRYVQLSVRIRYHASWYPYVAYFDDGDIYHCSCEILS